MKRKPFTKGEWALVFLPLIVLLAFSWLPFSSLHDEWLIRKHKAQSSWHVLEWSPDSRFVVLGGGVHVSGAQPGVRRSATQPLLSRGDVEVYDFKGRFVRRFVGHGSPVNDVHFSPDGKRLLSSNGGGFRIWDVEDGNQLLMVKMEYSSVQWSTDGKHIVGRRAELTRSAVDGASTYTHSYFRVDPLSGVQTPMEKPSERVQYGRVVSKTGLVAVQRPIMARRFAQQSTGYERPTLGGQIDILNSRGKRILTFNADTAGDMAWRDDDHLVRLSKIEGSGVTVGMALLSIDVRSRKQKYRMLSLEPIEKPTPVPTPSLKQSTYAFTYAGPTAHDPQYSRISKNGRRAVVWSSKTLWLIDTGSGAVTASFPINLYCANCQFSPDGRALAWTDGRTLHVVDAGTGQHFS